MTDQENRFTDYCDAEIRAQLQKMRMEYYEVPTYRKRWSIEELELLRRLAKAGYGIAVTLDRSERAVASKMRERSIFKPVYKNRKEREAKAQTDQMEG